MKILTQREAKHKPSSYSLSLICSFDETKNRRKFYRRKDCIENFCRDSKELATEIINYKEEEMTTLTSDEVTLYESQKVYAQREAKHKPSSYSLSLICSFEERIVLKIFAEIHRSLPQK